MFGQVYQKICRGFESHTILDGNGVKAIPFLYVTNPDMFSADMLFLDFYSGHETGENCMC